MKFTNGGNTARHIRTLLRVRLMQHALIAFAGRTWLIRIDTRYDHDTVFDLLRNLLQTIAIFKYRILMIG